jgi:hypothetical protein
MNARDRRRELRHARLVAQDAAARDAAARGIDGQHRHALSLLRQQRAERVDERALAHAGHAADAHAPRATGERQERREHLCAWATCRGRRSPPA